MFRKPNFTNSSFKISHLPTFNNFGSSNFQLFGQTLLLGRTSFSANLLIGAYCSPFKKQSKTQTNIKSVGAILCALSRLKLVSRLLILKATCGSCARHTLLLLGQGDS